MWMLCCIQITLLPFWVRGKKLDGTRVPKRTDEDRTRTWWVYYHSTLPNQYPINIPRLEGGNTCYSHMFFEQNLSFQTNDAYQSSLQIRTHLGGASRARRDATPVSPAASSHSQLSSDPKLLYTAYSSQSNADPGTSLAVQWLRLCASTARGMGSVPGQRTEITVHGMWCGWNDIQRTKVKRAETKQNKMELCYLL